MVGPSGVPAASSGRAGDGELGGPARRRRFSDADRAAILDDLSSSGDSVAVVAARHEISTSLIYRWQGRAGGGRETKTPSPAATKRQRRHGADERRRLVEAFLSSGMTQESFARTFDLAQKTLSRWLRAYESGGPRGLEPGRPGRPKGSRSAAEAFGRISPEVRAEVIRTGRSFPGFGLKKIRDFLFRFRGQKVSTGGIRRVLEDEGVPRPEPPARKATRKPSPPRRFERARPMQLWQSDITSFYLGRDSRHVYLTVFIDDHSRYVVSFALRRRQTQDLVIEALQEGIARFGKPEEILTDQGRQYFAWRGRSAFEKWLQREGIKHVVSRAHHPETLGKCERLWETINRELWSRTKPRDLADATQKLRHYFSHYNHFRPHQGIGGMLPADRFFEAESAVRKGLESAMSDHELRLALEEPRRRPVFLFGQIGERQVSLHGEHGRIVIQTEDGIRQEIAMEAPVEIETPTSQEENDDERGSDEYEVPDRDADDGDGDGRRPAAWPSRQEAHALCDPEPDGAWRAGALGAGEPAGEGPCAPDQRADPGDLARPQESQGGRGGAADPLGPAAPAEPAGALGDAGGLDSPAEAKAAAGGDGGEPGERALTASP